MPPPHAAAAVPARLPPAGVAPHPTHRQGCPAAGPFPVAVLLQRVQRPVPVPVPVLVLVLVPLPLSFSRKRDEQWQLEPLHACLCVCLQQECTGAGKRSSSSVQGRWAGALPLAAGAALGLHAAVD